MLTCYITIYSYDYVVWLGNIYIKKRIYIAMLTNCEVINLLETC